MERWKLIDGTNGKLMVSDSGSIRENERRKKKIIGTNQNNEILHFESISEAERYIGSRHITDVLKGKRNHVKGWTFKYA